jgi:hypothetical protein
VEGKINGHQSISIRRTTDDIARCSVTVGLDACAALHDGLFFVFVLQPAPTGLNAVRGLGQLLLVHH